MNIAIHFTHRQPLRPFTRAHSDAQSSARASTARKSNRNAGNNCTLTLELINRACSSDAFAPPPPAASRVSGSAICESRPLGGRRSFGQRFVTCLLRHPVIYRRNRKHSSHSPIHFDGNYCYLLSLDYNSMNKSASIRRESAKRSENNGRPTERGNK